MPRIRTTALLLAIVLALFFFGCAPVQRTVIRERVDRSPPEERNQYTVAVFVERPTSREMEPLVGIIRRDVRRYCALTIVGVYPLTAKEQRGRNREIIHPHNYELVVETSTARGATFITEPRSGRRRPLERAVVDAVLTWVRLPDPISEGRGEADFDRRDGGEHTARRIAAEKAILEVCTTIKEIWERKNDQERRVFPPYPSS